MRGPEPETPKGFPGDHFFPSEKNLPTIWKSFKVLEKKMAKAFVELNW